MSSPSIPLIVDTDGGVDDLAALAFLAVSPEVQLLGVIATGISRASSLAARNASAVLRDYGRVDVPVVRGLDEPTGPTPAVPIPTMHGPEGIGRATLPPEAGSGQWQQLRKLVRAQRSVTLLTLGPMSTTAARLRDEPTIDSIRVMGGSVSGHGNVLPGVEANVARDPAAAAAVISHRWPGGARLIPIEATRSAPVDRPTHRALVEDRRAQRLLAPALEFYAGHAGGDSYACHDLVAAALTAIPSLAEWDEYPIAVDTGGSAAWGSTVVDRRPVELRSAEPRWTAWGIPTAVDGPNLWRNVLQAFSRTM